MIDERAIGVHSVGNQASKQVGNEVTVAARDSVEPIEFKKDAVGLVDFGTSAAAGTTVGAGRWPTDRIARRWPVVGDEVCRSGATTGTHCGVVVARHGMHQYLTSADMRRSAGGDSGGAVWLKPATPDRYPVIVGIWLGDFTSASGVVRGRFHGLWDAFSLLGVV